MIKFHPINPVIFQASAADQLNKHMEAFREHQELYLRSAFDAALTDATAASVIYLAESDGFLALAQEMKDDFRNITGRDYSPFATNL